MRKWISGLLTLALASALVGCSTLAVQPPADTLPSSDEDLQPPTTQVSDAPPTPTDEPGAAPVRADLPDLGPAPELANEVWLNTDQALRLSELRGQVVLLDMWTFG